MLCYTNIVTAGEVSLRVFEAISYMVNLHKYCA
jgi:hypothetical protein